MARAALMLTLLALSLTAGCLDDTDSLGGSGSLDGIPPGQAPTGEGAGSPAEHGNHERTESDVTISRQGSDYLAKKTITLSNDFGGAPNADVKLTTRAGGVTAEAWDDGGYEVVATLQGRGATEQEARANLAQLKVVHSDRLGAGRLTLDTQVQFPAEANRHSGSLVAHLPASPAYRITGTTNAGGVDVSGLGGPSVTLDSDAGGVSVAGAFNTATLTTAAGGVELNGVFNVVKASASAGGVSGRISPSASGTLDLESSAGGIDLMLGSDDGQAYDVEADVSAGSIRIALGDTDAIGTQSNNHKHVRSAGFEDAPIQVTVTVQTAAGGIDVGGY